MGSFKYKQSEESGSQSSDNDIQNKAAEQGLSVHCDPPRETGTTCSVVLCGKTSP